MRIELTRLWKKVVMAGAMAALALVAGMGSTLPSAYAGGTIKADDDKWISLDGSNPICGSSVSILCTAPCDRSGSMA